MKAISPFDALGDKVKVILEKVDELESNISEYMTKNWWGEFGNNNCMVYVLPKVDSPYSRKILNSCLERFENKGWEIQIEDSGRDNKITFSEKLKPKKTSLKTKQEWQEENNPN